MKLQLINTLSESKIFRTTKSLEKFSESEMDELFYMYLLALLATALDTNTTAWAKKYAAKTAAFANFSYFRASATDLYVLAYDVFGRYQKLGQVTDRILVRFLRDLADGEISKGNVERTLYRIERALGITNSRLRTARRMVVNWATATEAGRRNVVATLERLIRVHSPVAEIVPQLKLLLTGEQPDKAGLGTFLGTAAAAGLASYWLGSKLLNIGGGKPFKLGEK